MVVKVGFIKLGNLSTSQVIDLLLDEIAAREGIDVRTFGTGAKMSKNEADATAEFKNWKPDFAVMISPNSMAPGPTAARDVWKGVPVVVVSDGPAKKEDRQKLEEAGFGYIILPVDPLIGAKREFLDSTEMSLFNTDALKVLSAGGAIRLVTEELDKLVDQVAQGKKPELPKILAKPEKCIEKAGYTNPYAKAKALAALHIATKVAEIDFPACFVLKEVEEIATTAAAGHEAMRAAGKLADEAREMEKANDSVLRRPHAKDGRLLSKKKLLEKQQ
ncbi:MAG TPA: F420-dependent methylenetetrahydromethanopterin dehydrogenase [Candidatus Methanoperedenaceae archaeon]|nr:F420-dependent methylenetetrahydromethanopterin dehydrogenase [Candidatus Methanoperedenaceae archaeon]